MKRHSFLLFVAAVVSTTASANVIDMGGTNARLDTMESYQVGPGTVYSHIQMTKGSKVRQVYLLDIDLKNPYITLETILANDKLATTETLANMYKRKDAAGHRLVGGINANFWCVGQTVDAAPSEYDGQLNMPLQGCMSNGMIATDVSSWDRDGRRADGEAKDIGYFVLTRDKKGIARDMRSIATVTIKGSSMGIRDINRKRTFTQEDRLTLYNKHCGSTLSGKCGKEVVFDVTGEWTVNKEMTCTVTGINTKGGTALTGNQGALQGFQAGVTFLEALNIGDTFTLNIALTDRETGTPYDVYQMVSGNALVMVDGELTQRNYNEQYNSQDYPRPIIATNATNDRVWLLECAPSGGLSTAEGCYILRSMGATNAGSYDGGGSAQMNIFGQNMFKTTESTPRPIILGLWVVSTASDTQEAGKMEFLNPLASIPGYASYTPTIRAWSKEGLLLSHDYKNYVLSCEPATLGTINGMTFTAAPTNAEGLLVATCGDTRATTPISIRDGKVQFRLDTVVLDTDYEVEVEAIAGNLILPMSGKAMQWSSEDESVATVSEGIIHPIKNGRTIVKGSLSENSDEISVSVEKVFAPHTAITKENAPASLDTTFRFSVTRGAKLLMPMDFRWYGCPDSVLVTITCSADVASAEMMFYVANSTKKQTYKVAQACAANTESTFTFSVDKMADVTDRGIYPIQLEALRFMFDNIKSNTDYTMNIKEIIFCYNRWEDITGLEDIKTKQPSFSQKIMVNGQMYIISNGIIYNMQGKIIDK